MTPMCVLTWPYLNIQKKMYSHHQTVGDRKSTNFIFNRQSFFYHQVVGENKTNIFYSNLPIIWMSTCVIVICFCSTRKNKLIHTELNCFKNIYFVKSYDDSFAGFAFNCVRNALKCIMRERVKPS